MDITRNWRLKTQRSQFLATRDPLTGAVTLPQNTLASELDELYVFEPIDWEAVMKKRKNGHIVIEGSNGNGHNTEENLTDYVPQIETVSRSPER